MTAIPVTLPVFVYDGDCGFCTRSAQLLRRLVPSSRLAIEPGFELDLDELGLTPDDVLTAAWYVDGLDAPRPGHLSIAAALRHSPYPPVRLAGFLLAVPPLTWLGRPAYAWVAANRHRLPGATATCGIDRLPAD